MNTIVSFVRVFPISKYKKLLFSKIRHSTALKQITNEEAIRQIRISVFVQDTTTSNLFVPLGMMRCGYDILSKPRYTFSNYYMKKAMHP